MEAKTGECAWCGEVRPLCKSHLITKAWGRKARQAAGKLYQTESSGEGRPTEAREVQDGLKLRMLCEGCEQGFGRTEKAVVENWRCMAQGNWIPVDRKDPCWRRMGLPKPERGTTRRRWVGVAAEPWRKIAAITAWRTAASPHAGSLEKERDNLRWLVEANHEERSRFPLLFQWVASERIGLTSGESSNAAGEILPYLTPFGLIRMTFAGFTLTLGWTESAKENRILRGLDIQEERGSERGTWLQLVHDFDRGDTAQHMEEWMAGIKLCLNKSRAKRNM